MAKNKTWQDIGQPIVVLTVICLVTALLLALLNSATAPIIEANTKRAEDALRRQLLPSASDFEVVSYNGPDVVAVYKATNGSGYVITGSAKGYGGQLPVMVAFDQSGKIISTRVLDNAETPGLGKKTMEPDFKDQFLGKGDKTLQLKQDITAITGATISSGAATKAVNGAITAFQALEKGGAIPKELTPEERVASLLPEGTATTLSDKKGEGIRAIYTSDAGTVIVAEAPGYDKKPVIAYVLFDNAGVIQKMNVDAAQQTDGLGTEVCKEDCIKQYVGKPNAEGVPNLTGATISSNGLKSAVNFAAAAFKTLKGA